MAKAAVTATAWISVTLVIIAILWLVEIGDLLMMILMIFLLLAIPFALTLMLLLSKETK